MWAILRPILRIRFRLRYPCPLRSRTWPIIPNPTPAFPQCDLIREDRLILHPQAPTIIMVRDNPLRHRPSLTMVPERVRDICLKLDPRPLTRVTILLTPLHPMVKKTKCGRLAGVIRRRPLRRPKWNPPMDARAITAAPGIGGIAIEIMMRGIGIIGARRAMSEIIITGIITVEVAPTRVGTGRLRRILIVISVRRCDSSVASFSFVSRARPSVVRGWVKEDENKTHTEWRICRIASAETSFLLKYKNQPIVSHSSRGVGGPIVLERHC